MKNKNILALLESHVDKIVLAVGVLASLFLLWLFVIGNPYGEKVRVGGRERKLSPSQIDRYVKQEAEALLPKLDEPAPPPPPRKEDYLSEYSQLLQSSLSGVSSSIRIPSPGAGDVVVQEDRLYALPEIPSLTEAAVGSLRGAAKVPTEEISPDRLYASSMSEIEDIDLVTVSAWFDVQALYGNFQQSFMGPRLKTSWKDDRLAVPVFARLQVQRRVRQDRDNWGQWESVRRTAVDPHRKLLEELPEVLDVSSFGVDIWISQYEDKDVQHDILQPEAYLFTISRLEWMAPEFLVEALEILKKEDEKERRERQEELRDRATRTTDTRRSRNRRQPTRQPNRRGAADRGGDRGGIMMDGMAPMTRVTPVREERSVDDVQKDFEDELLDDKSDVGSIQDPLLIWAHDDTAKPGETYQYRIRIGVFNPISGKDWFQTDQADYKNQIVLWSDYSEPTAAVSVPKRIYVFPMDVVADKDTPNDIEGVQVEVAKYYLGRWRDFDFEVFPGQVVGYEVEDVQEEDDTQNVMGDYRPMMDEMGMGQEPEKIDFTSDITLVDVSREVVWGSRLRAGTLYKMLYYDTENKMQQAAVGRSNWSSDRRGVYDEIQKSMTQDVEQRSPGMMQGMPMDEMMPGMMPGFPGME